MGIFFKSKNEVAVLILLTILCLGLIPIIVSAEHECELRNPAQQSECIVFKSHDPGGGPGVVNPNASVNSGVEKGYKALANIPGLQTQTSLAGLANALIRLLIAVGAIIAVVKITYAGIVYMGSESFGGKQQAKDDIVNSIFGLLIILATVLIIYTIFGNITLNSISNLTPVKPIPASAIQDRLNTSLGCNQGLQASCTAASAGQVAYFEGTSRKCIAAGSVPYAPNQSTLSRITENDCNGMGGDGKTAAEAAIAAGKEIIGYTTKTGEQIQTWCAQNNIRSEETVLGFGTGSIPPACVNAYSTNVINSECEKVDPAQTVKTAWECDSSLVGLACTKYLPATNFDFVCVEQ